MKKIIVPIDFSQHSENALKIAAQLAKKHNCQLIIMHMLEFSESILSASNSQNNEQMRFKLALAKKKIKTFLNKEYLKGVDILPVIKRYKIFKEIDLYSKELNVDLIVMAAKGNNSKEGILTGSNTQRVVNQSEIPVLIVKNSDSVAFKKVILGTNFSLRTVTTFKKALKLLTILNLDIKLLHVNLKNRGFRSTTEIKEKMRIFIEEVGDHQVFKNVEFVSDYTVGDGILNYRELVDADVIASVMTGKIGLGHFILGNASEDVLNHSPYPILAFKI